MIKKNNGKDNDQNKYELRKVSFLEKYSVTNFPYSGMHRYSPFVCRSVDGGYNYLKLYFRADNQTI